MQKVTKKSPDYFLNLIRQNKPFSLSRFGDGEVLCMFHNHMKTNCDGSRFLTELIYPMKQIFVNEHPYYHCLLNCSFDINGDKFKAFIDETCPDMPFYDGEIWSELSFDGRMTELCQVLDKHSPVFVGGEHLLNTKYMYGFTDVSHIVTPSVDSFTAIDDIMGKIIEKYNEGSRMFLFSAGYTTKILIDSLYPIFGGDTFMIDMGSVFDPYCGVLSRDGHVSRGFDYFQAYTSLELGDVI